MRRVAELVPDRSPRVLSVARIAGTPLPWDQYIFAADELARQGRYALAVIAAQIHCEMFIRHALTTVAQHDGSRVALAALDMLQSCSLTDRTGPQVFEAFLGAKPNAAECWERYHAHVIRRNRVAHHGAPVTSSDAQASIGAVVEMVRFVDERLRSRLASERAPTAAA